MQFSYFFVITVIFSQASVNNSVQGGICFSACWDTRAPPWAGTPPDPLAKYMLGYPPAQCMLGYTWLLLRIVRILLECILVYIDCNQWRIQDFPQGGAPTPKSAIIFQFFAENCMKMKEFGPPGGARVPGAPPWIRQWLMPGIKKKLSFTIFIHLLGNLQYLIQYFTMKQTYILVQLI